MKVLRRHLERFVTLTGKSDDQIATALTMAGIEVDQMLSITSGYTGVVAARVVNTQKHPNADKLTIAEVDDGKELYTVVCGAPNCRPGIITAFAKIGAVLNDSSTNESFCVNEAELRGVRSFGMLCSESELGFSEEHDGIIEFDESQPLGQDLSLLRNDTLFCLSLTPNLGHCLSVLGIAREIGAMLELVVQEPSESQDAFGRIYTIEQQGTGCTRYSAMTIRGVDGSKKAPLWMRLGLEDSGFRSVNALVDTTNWIMLQYGQPMHAFDRAKVSGNTIVIRHGNEEKMLFLDDKERTVTQDTVLICDHARPIAAGGVLGGKESSVSIETKEIILESATFEASAIRRSKRSLGVFSDAAHRFERGTDQSMTKKALKEAFSIIKSIYPECICEALDDKIFHEQSKRTIRCRLARIELLIGYTITMSEAEYALRRIGCLVERDPKEQEFNVIVPLYRNDLTEEVDLIEEIAKIFGYMAANEISVKHTDSVLQDNPAYIFEKNMRTLLLQSDLQEVVCCDLISPRQANLVLMHPIEPESFVVVLNPTSQEQSILRPSLLPGMLDVVARNNNHSIYDLALFEIGNVHLKKENKYQEERECAILLSGKRNPKHFTDKNEEVDFFDLKGILEVVFKRHNFKNIAYTPTNHSIFHPGRQARIIVEGTHVGVIAEVHPSILSQYDIKERVFFAAYNLNDVIELVPEKEKVQPLTLFPESQRDWTYTVSEEVTYSSIRDAIEAFGSLLLDSESISLVSIYRDAALGVGKKNMTFRFVYRDKERTLEQKEVDTEHERLTTFVMEKT